MQIYLSDYITAGWNSISQLSVIALKQSVCLVSDTWLHLNKSVCLSMTYRQLYYCIIHYFCIYC